MIERGASAGFLEGCGWVCVRSAGSLGPVDIVALATVGAIYPEGDAGGHARHIAPAAAPRETLLIEAKSSPYPFENFRPADRRELFELAESVGAAPWLANKAKGARGWEWIPYWRWPNWPATDVLEGDGSRRSRRANLPKTLEQPHPSG